MKTNKYLTWLVIFLAISPTAFALTSSTPVLLDSASSTAVTQATGTNLHAVIDSGTITNGAGSAIMGKVGIDQTTPGTTNLVSIGSNGAVGLNAGSNLIGKFGIDQTTPGTTNKVSIGTDGSVAAVLSAETTKVIGTVNISAGQSISTTAPAVSTRSDTFTAAANGTTVDVHLVGLKYFSIGCKGTGAAATSWTIVLEGSNDNVNFTTILTHTNTVLADGQTLYSGTSAAPSLYYRSRASAVTLGSATNIICTIVGM